MGKEKHIRNIERLFEKSPVLSSKTIERVVKDKNKTTQYQKQLIRNMILSGKIKRLSKGCYTIHDEPSLAVFCFKPAYLGLQDAFSFHNLWEQETIPIIITSRKVRQGIRRVMGMNVMVRRIEKKYLFGFECSKEQFYLPYSDIEKTFIDMIYFKERIGDQTKKEIIKKIDKKKLHFYLKKYPKRFRTRIKNLMAS